MIPFGWRRLGPGMLEHRDPKTPILWDEHDGIVRVHHSGKWRPVDGAASAHDAYVAGVRWLMVFDRCVDRRNEIERAGRDRRAASRAAAGTPVADRARKYLSKMEPSIAGSSGAAALMRAAAALMSKWDLTVEQALPLLEEWDAGCSVPPWGRRECLRALRSAARRRAA